MVAVAHQAVVRLQLVYGAVFDTLESHFPSFIATGEPGPNRNYVDFRDFHISVPPEQTAKK
jgi:hypothetical protein